MFGRNVTKGRKIDFQWPQQSDLSVFSKYDSFELSHLVMKGDPGKNLLGIGLAFTNGFMTPMSEPDLYSSYVTSSFAYDLDLEKPYNQIYVKVAKQGENDSVITGIRLGSLGGTFAFHHEWRKLGEW